MPAIKRLCVTVLLLSLVLVWTGCSTTTDYKEPISKFQKSVGASSVAISTYYLEMNRFERNLYLAMRLLDEKQLLKSKVIKGETFPAKSIRARLEAIRLLGVYSQRLAELAGTDAPERFATGMETLGTNLGTLANTFLSLSNDSTAQDYTKQLGVLGKIAGQVGKMLLERKRDAALTEAIIEGEGPVNKILGLLETDLVDRIDLLQKSGTSVELADYVNKYNELIKSSDYTQLSWQQRHKLRKQLLGEIRKAAVRREIAVAFNPSSLVKDMKEAHEALVEYAKSDRTPKDLTELVSAMEAFEARVQQMAAAIQELRNLRKGA